jgi:hypothetical protein
MHLLRFRHFPEYTAEQFFAQKETKPFQRSYLTRIIKKFIDPKHTVAEIGSHSVFTLLEASGAKIQAIIDPYTGGKGGGISHIPNLPYPTVLFRCEIGLDSEIIPDAFFNATFSCSVIEHVGQAEANYDCMPTENPPQEQETIRDRFCRELYRITKPGGLTFHTVDHAARNLTFQRNFEAEGFVLKPVDEEPISLVGEALFAEDVVRQRHDWVKVDQPFSDDEQRLHGVLFMCFEKPRT